MERLFVFTSYSTNYTPVYEHFLKSYVDAGLPRERLHVYKYDMSEYSAYGFRTASWYRSLQEKMKFFAGMIRWMPTDAIGAFVDADIQWFPNADQLNKQLHRLEKLDMLWMREKDTAQVNGGLFFARKTDNAMRVIDHALLMNLTHELPYGEQTAINDMLAKDPHVSWDFLDEGCVVWSNILPSDPTRAFAHHAVATKGVPDKMSQLTWVRERVLGQSPRHTSS